MDELILANSIARKYYTNDISSFVLKNALKLNQEQLTQVALQMESIKKGSSKLPSFVETEGVIMPPPLSIEQASSEETATFKSNLISGNSLLDLTGGMGIDMFYMSKKFLKCVYIEQNKQISTISEYNFKILDKQSIEVLNTTAQRYLASNTLQFDWIYLDPARRDASKNKIFLLDDCEPNIIELKEQIFEHTQNILIKTSPLLDIKMAINQLKNVVEVYVISLKNEVKELLFILKKGVETEPNIFAINLQNQSTTFEFTYADEINCSSIFALPQQFLYEPNASILKAGAFKSIAQYFGLEKLSANSHLYTSQNFVPDFHGRSFKINQITKFDKKQILSHLKNNKANITTRNFPMSVEEIRKKLQIKDGGDIYLFFTEDKEQNKIVLITEKV